MRKLKITEGEIQLIGREIIGEKSICLVAHNTETVGNAQLIADVFNTANKCDMLPSELLEQRDEVISLLKRIVIAVEQKHADKFGFGKPILDADTFIKKVFDNE